METCKYQRTVHRYADGETTPEEARALEAHLKTCASCEALMTDLNKIRLMVTAMTPVRPEPGFFDDVRRRAATLADRRQSVSEWFAVEVWSRRLVPIAACLCIMLGSIAFVTYRNSETAAAQAETPTYVSYALGEADQAVLTGSSDTSLQSFYQTMK
jgi:anti-sigma factor RsiW